MTIRSGSENILSAEACISRVLPVVSIILIVIIINGKLANGTKRHSLRRERKSFANPQNNLHSYSDDFIFVSLSVCASHFVNDGVVARTWSEAVRRACPLSGRPGINARVVVVV